MGRQYRFLGSVHLTAGFGNPGRHAVGFLGLTGNPTAKLRVNCARQRVAKPSTCGFSWLGPYLTATNLQDFPTLASPREEGPWPLTSAPDFGFTRGLARSQTAAPVQRPTPSVSSRFRIPAAHGDTC